MKLELFDEALIFAAQKHSGQRRKSSTTPYILHTAEVASIVATMTDDQEVIAAAVLHDTVEDAGVGLDEIRERFGERVAYLVRSETENKRPGTPLEDTWMIRKQESLEMLKNADDVGIKMVWLGDKVSNMRSFYRQYRVMGDDMWQKYRQKDPAVQAWYYKSIAEYTSELKDTDAYAEYIELLHKIFGQL